MNEWKDIPGYNGIYQINRVGEIYRLPTTNTLGRKGMIRKHYKHHNGYIYISLDKDKQSKCVRVHRLVALIFIPNPENKPQVNHINGIKDDNRVENLEWCTASENMQHAYKEGLINVSKGSNHYMHGKRGKEHHNSIEINQLSLDGEFIKKWDSAVDIHKELGINRGNISMVCKGQRNQTGGYKWEYH